MYFRVNVFLIKDNFDQMYLEQV